MNNNLKWNFIATKKKQDAYENIIDKLNPCSSEEFNTLSEEQKNKILDDMIKEIRKINIFPIYYFNDEGIREEIRKSIDKKVCFSGESLDILFSQGLLLLDFLFPNLHKVEVGDYKNRSIYDRFYDDEMLKECLKIALSSRKINNMRTAFFMGSRFLWRSATNYSPMRAKAIYERFCPKDGVIYDYSAGFGGRMLGALSSSYNFKYIATEPNTETYHNLLKLGKYIEQETKRADSYKVYNDCSEDLKLEPEFADFIFSCPPYFNLEKYSDEETQSMNKFPNYEEWLEGYVRPTIKNSFYMLKKEGLYGVNIVNFWNKAKKYYLTNDWLKIAEEEGFYLKGVYSISSKARKKKDEDQDRIYIFSKNKDYELPNYTDAEMLEYWDKKVKDYEEKKKKKDAVIVKFNFLGELEDRFENILQISNKYNIEDVKKSIKTKKKCKEYNCYFRSFAPDDIIPLMIEDIKKPVCEIDGIIFETGVAAAEYLKTPKQTVSQAKQRKSKKILGHEVKWF